MCKQFVFQVHSFFGPLPCDINSIRRTQAPYTPRIAHPTDTSNFDPCDAEKDPSDSGNPPDNQFHGFYEFTFRRFFDDAYNEECIFNTGGASGGNNNNNNNNNGGGGGNGGGGDGSSSGPVYV